MNRVTSLVTALASAVLVSACVAPPPPNRSVAPAVATARLPEPPRPAPSVAAPPAKQAEPAQHLSVDAAREAAERAFVRLQPALANGARLGRPEEGAACEHGACAWQWRILVGADAVIGALEVDATSAVFFAPNDGQGGRLAIDAFLAREAERKKAVEAVASLPLVKAYCKKVQAQKLGCLIYFEEGPSEEGCAASPPLESSCWMRVYVGEAHPDHTSRFGTFLVAPGTSRVVGASGYCDPVPLAQFHGSGSGCPR